MDEDEDRFPDEFVVGFSLSHQHTQQHQTNINIGNNKNIMTRRNDNKSKYYPYRNAYLHRSVSFLHQQHHYHKNHYLRMHHHTDSQHHIMPHLILPSSQYHSHQKEPQRKNGKNGKTHKNHNKNDTNNQSNPHRLRHDKYFFCN